MAEVLSIHVQIWKTETCLSHFKESRGRGSMIERMNQIGVQYMYIWKCHNKNPYITVIY
jgi:hypothetical protein